MSRKIRSVLLRDVPQPYHPISDFLEENSFNATIDPNWFRIRIFKSRNYKGFTEEDLLIFKIMGLNFSEEDIEWYD